SVLENQGNGLAKVRQTFLARFALPIGARHFSAVGDMPWAVSLDDRREFVAHFFILPLRRRSRICFDPESAWPVHREAPATEAGRNAGCVACPRNPETHGAGLWSLPEQCFEIASSMHCAENQNV